MDDFVGELDMRVFAKTIGTTMTFPANSLVFQRGDPGDCMYVVQTGTLEMLIGSTVVEVCKPNEAVGFLSMIDGAARSSTARVSEAAELSVIDKRRFRYMVDEVPNFALYIMGAMSRRIRGMGNAL